MGDGSSRGGFGTQFGFIMAAAGSAVGLGNIWKFPYITGEYGGGAFVLVYLACIVLVGLPLMYAELIIGRRGGTDVVGALRKLAGQGKGRDLAGLTGAMAVLTGFLILSFYSVVAGWAVHFLFVSMDLIPMEAGGAGPTFDVVTGTPLLSATWHTVFMVLTLGVVAAGIQGGIERITKRLMPALIGLLLCLLAYVAITTPTGLVAALSFLFVPDFSKLGGDAVLEALGHAFFTLSLGMGAMVTYGSYLGSDKHVVRDGLIIALLDTFIALLAGAVIFSVVFSQGQEASAGPGLVFVTLPDLFATMPGGKVVAIAFFLLLIFAAWSSAISLLEVVVAWLVDEHGLARRTATYGAGSLIWAVGVACCYYMVIIDFLDNLTTMYMLPLGGLAIAIAAGWFVKPEDSLAGFEGVPGGAMLAVAWTWTIRIITPALVALVILGKMGIFE